MKLLPLADEAALDLACGWLADAGNRQWLQFGDSTRPIPAASLKVMTQRPAHCMRLFTSETGTPIGIVALGDIHPVFRTATIWIVLGDKRLAGQHYGRRAMGRCLRLGFGELGLRSVTTWVVDSNVASRRMVDAVGFRLIGRQRQCHVIDGQMHDRLLFDLLPGELREA